MTNIIETTIRLHKERGDELRDYYHDLISELMSYNRNSNKYKKTYYKAEITLKVLKLRGKVLDILEFAQRFDEPNPFYSPNSELYNAAAIEVKVKCEGREEELKKAFG